MDLPRSGILDYISPIQDPELMGEARAIEETTKATLREALDQARVNRFLRSAEVDYSHGIESDTFAAPMTADQWYDYHMRMIYEHHAEYPLTSLVEGEALMAFDMAMKRQRWRHRAFYTFRESLESWLLSLADWVGGRGR